ncbi:MAG TPA: sulfatase-like hydrolase/transferase [Candidatus Binataceae bacterium]|nr:sulfatase-like hydrolase/transferase [Candidatus Binataceae bacterium]
MNRREFLRLAGLGGLGAMLPSAGFGDIRELISRTAPMLERPNILILMTDEQRAVRDWPAGWADANLPSLGRLRAHGINFNSAFANACQCSPSRSTFLTSTYAPVNRATLTPATLNPALPNLATIFAAAGYNVVYKGKWHLTASFVLPFAADSSQDVSDIIASDQAMQATYGFSGWNSPDAGTSLTQAASLGGGLGGNDARYVSGTSAGTATNVLQFLSTYDSDAPFCLIVSLVNPHDVFVYPKDVVASGYDVSAFSSLPIELPPTYGEDLSTKPAVQASFVESLNNVWPFAMGAEPVLYSRFYAYLNILADAELMQILDLLDAKGLTEKTLIVRVADHGELGLAHGGLRQKDYAAYEEMIHIPMIFSNPLLFPRPLETDALGGLIDVLPTLMAVAGIKPEPELHLQGQSLAPLFDNPRGSIQERILFTYDDGLFLPLPVQGAAHIRCIREANWKFAMYFDPAGAYPTEYEMYDLIRDPLETANLAHRPTPIQYQFERLRLESALLEMMAATRTLPSQIEPPT